jgi:hypothetical protein
MTKKFFELNEFDMDLRIHDEGRQDPRPLLCRFSDAGSDEPSTRSGGRRLKSAKARNRGKWGTVGARALWGFSRGVRLGEVGQSARPDRFASQDGCG